MSVDAVFASTRRKKSGSHNKNLGWLQDGQLGPYWEKNHTHIYGSSHTSSCKIFGQSTNAPSSILIAQFIYNWLSSLEL